ncbi:potassium channel family protein [Occultella gossypii]|uniref:Two pore domain potassium channel family protein n=1 Tax=Occultella gossypii TaxID=2800820 RepID=A0ABS7S9R7_9MICO|nr:potassium channel family protein [Occultella gossypii]MBZ2197089.1 two pore domain potassium channel family protein [Occultella gossypii]
MSAVAVLVVYYALPLDGPSVGALVALGLGLAALAGMLVWQIRAIARSRRPRLRAIEALATAIPFFLVLFAAVYVGLSRGDPAAFTESLDRTDALYFTVTTFATVGYGDIAPVVNEARIIATVQMLTGMALLGGGLKLVLGAVRVGLNREAGQPGPTDATDATDASGATGSGGARPSSPDLSARPRPRT